MKMASLVLSGALATGSAVGAVVEIAPCNGNATPAVRAAVERLRDGGTLRFAPGEYHFFEEGAKDLFLASVGSSTGMKKVILHLKGLKDVTVDGGGAEFFFHGNTFPLVAAHCDGLKVGNFASRLPLLPIVEFTILEKGDAGFLCQFGQNHPPYDVKPDGTILFKSGEGLVDSSAHELSIHALRYCQIQYLATPGCRCDRDTLASTFYAAAAEDRGNGRVFFRYVGDPHPKNAGKCSFPVNEPLCILLACKRNRSLISIADCRDVEIADVEARSGSGMGIVAEMEHPHPALQGRPRRGEHRLHHRRHDLPRGHEGAHRDRGFRIELVA